MTAHDTERSKMGYCDSDHRYPSPTMEGQGPQWPHIKTQNCINWHTTPSPVPKKDNWVPADDYLAPNNE